MRFELVFTEHADEQMDELEMAKDKKAVVKAVNKILGFMETNLRHPSLHTHKYDEMTGPNGEDVFESYAQKKTTTIFFSGVYVFLIKITSNN